MEPKKLCGGVSWAIVNGTPVLADGKFTGKTPGRPLTSKDS